MFPTIPADLGPLSDDDLTAALEAHIAVARKAKAKDADLIASLPGDNDAERGTALIDAVTAGVTDIERIKAEMADRAAGGVALDAKLDELTAGIEDEPVAAAEPVTDPPAADESVADPDEPVADAPVVDEPVADAPVADAPVADAPVADAPAADAPVAEPVLASAQPRFTLPRAPKRHEPIQEVDVNRKFPLTAAAGLADFAAGAEMTKLDLAKALIDKRSRMTSTAPGVREEVIVASARWDYPEDRVLNPRDSFAATQEKIDAVVGEEALVAAGGLCAPVTNYYDLANVSVPDRPVRDALAAFQAVRGGLKFAAVPVLGDVTSAISYITEAEDSQGGTFATKSCQVVECPEFSEVDVAIIAHCIQFGNLGSRAFPEQVAQFSDLVMAAHARVAETALLDGLSAASTQVTAATPALYGYQGISGLLGEILTAAAGMRSRNRMAAGSRLRWIGPEWVKQWLIADLANSQFERFSRDEAGVIALLRTLGGIEPSFTLDGQSGAAQVYGAQGAGALTQFPATIRWYLFPEGSFLFLDGGELELGIVRDSVLNAINDFQIFGETFENIAFIGVESIAVTSTLCPAGSTGGPVTAIC